MEANAEETMIYLIKQYLRCSPVVQAMFEDYRVSIDEIDSVPVSFKDLDVSAKTKNKRIFLNKDLLEDGFEDDIHYFVHELCHYLQQSTGDVLEYKDLDKQDYLEKPTEVEAFKYQVQFMRDYYGDSDAEQYVEDLLDFHEYSGEKRKDKKKKLLGE